MRRGSLFKFGDGFILAILGFACSFGAVEAVAAARSAPVFNEDMTAYKATKASGVIERLQDRLDRGETKLVYESRHGYLLSLLRELNLPTSSQVLVASKTSPNKALISPQNPRALYFNDHLSVAYVPLAEVLEIAAADPQLGVVFYTLDQAPSDKPRLKRNDRCLECHASSKTLNVPGLMVRSFQTDNGGDANMLSGILVTHRTPLAERWGGYYVTGLHGVQTHQGNLFGEVMRRHETDPSANGNITDLKPFLDVSKYPDAGSDLVALMVLEHQAHMQALLTRLNADAAQALSAGDSLRAAYPAFEATLKYMLFMDEARLAAPVRGAGGFAAWFAGQGPKDKQGRSLRQFDLQRRLFKFPCSFMIYSPSFDALSPPARKHFLHRLRQILDGEDSSGEYPNLSADARKAVREILNDTKTNLPMDWQF